MPEDIDYKALYESVQSELEQARLAIVKMRYAHRPFEHLTAEQVRQFVYKNYLLIIVAMMLLSLIFSSLKTIKGLFKP